MLQESRGQDCLRFLGGASMCGDKYLQLFAADDGSGQQRVSQRAAGVPRSGL
jgi:hypothetical protein